MSGFFQNVQDGGSRQREANRLARLQEIQDIARRHTNTCRGIVKPSRCNKARGCHWTGTDCVQDELDQEPPQQPTRSSQRQGKCRHDDLDECHADGCYWNRHTNACVSSLQRLTIPELKSRLREQNKAVSGKKDELVRRLGEVSQDHSESESDSSVAMRQRDDDAPPPEHRHQSLQRDIDRLRMEQDQRQRELGEISQASTTLASKVRGDTTRKQVGDIRNRMEDVVSDCESIDSLHEWEWDNTRNGSHDTCESYMETLPKGSQYYQRMAEKHEELDFGKSMGEAADAGIRDGDERDKRDVTLKLQATARRRAAQKQVGQMRSERNATRMVQALAKGHKARRQVGEMRHKYNNKLSECTNETLSLRRFNELDCNSDGDLPKHLQDQIRDHGETLNREADRRINSCLETGTSEDWTSSDDGCDSLLMDGETSYLPSNDARRDSLRRHHDSLHAPTPLQTSVIPPPHPSRTTLDLSSGSSLSDTESMRNSVESDFDTYCSDDYLRNHPEYQELCEIHRSEREFQREHEHRQQMRMDAEGQARQSDVSIGQHRSNVLQAHLTPTKAEHPPSPSDDGVVRQEAERVAAVEAAATQKLGETQATASAKLQGLSRGRKARQEAKSFKEHYHDELSATDNCDSVSGNDEWQDPYDCDNLMNHLETKISEASSDDERTRLTSLLNRLQRKKDQIAVHPGQVEHQRHVAQSDLSRKGHVAKLAETCDNASSLQEWTDSDCDSIVDEYEQMNPEKGARLRRHGNSFYQEARADTEARQMETLEGRSPKRGQHQPRPKHMGSSQKKQHKKR